MFDLLSSADLLRVTVPIGNANLAPAESLTTTITMEGLLFAAFAVGSKLTEWVDGGRHAFFSMGRFGWTIVVVLTFIAAAAAVSWVEVFGVGWPSSPGEFLVGLGLALGIVGQPVFAAVIHVELSKEEASA